MSRELSFYLIAVMVLKSFSIAGEIIITIELLLIFANQILAIGSRLIPIHLCSTETNPKQFIARYNKIQGNNYSISKKQLREMD
jgi:hypothetical protein